MERYRSPLPQRNKYPSTIRKTTASAPQCPSPVLHDGQLSYAELQQRANQLAHRLQQEGVQIGDIVALCANRSAAMIIAILAILKVGAAYLPLDPNQPAQRLSLLLQDARVACACGQRKYTPAARRRVEVHRYSTVTKRHRINRRTIAEHFSRSLQ